MTLRLCCILILVPFTLYAQPFTKDTYSVPVTANGGLIDHPFTGGLYNPMHQFEDIDADTDLDLFLFEPKDGRLSFFRNIGSPTSPQFLYEREPFALPVPFGWFRLADIDGDSRLDFLSSDAGGNALAVYLNDGTEQVPDFVLLTSALLDSAGEFVYCESFSVASFVDMDADRDLDFLSLNTSSGTINYYENIGDSANFLLAFRTDRFQDIQICIGCRRGLEEEHGNGSIHFGDIDSDSDYDLLYGDLFHFGLYYFENIGTPEVVELDSVTAWFPLGDSIVTTGYNQATLIDIDGDLDNDLFISVMSSIAIKDNFRFYENIGTPGSPDYQLSFLNYLETLDLDLQSAPAFVDIDGDSDKDLYVGNREGQVAFLRNTGSAVQPAFLLEDSIFISGTGSQVLAPVFTDIDADADMDMFLGTFFGKIDFYRNTGSASTPVFAREPWLFDTVSVGFSAGPSFFDAEGDGDQDLFVGKSNGTINFYRNTGSAQVPHFTLESTSFSGITVGGNCKPHFVDEDDDGDEDLLVGSGDGVLRLYENAGPPDNPVFALVTTTYGDIDSVHECAPVMTDLDGDGDQDLIIGCHRGGLELYMNDEITSVQGETGEIPERMMLDQNYPNPFNPKTEIGFRIGDFGFVSLRVYDILGREVAVLIDERLSPGEYMREWDAKDQPSGVYVYRLRSGGRSESRKMLLLK